MTKKVLQEQYEDIVRLLSNKHLREALPWLKDMLTGVTNWDLYSEYERIETAYNYMLQYMRQNVADPERKKLHNKLITEALEVADQVKILLEGTHALRTYHTTRNSLKSQHPHTIKSLLMELESYTEDITVAGLLTDNDDAFKKPQNIRERHEETQRNLFSLVWTNSLWSVQDRSEAKEMLESVLVPVQDLCLFASAVTMSLMECFDLQKLLWLFEAYEHHRNPVNQRALVGLAIAFQLYHGRMKLYPEITSRLAYFNEEDKFGQDLNRVQIQMLRGKETEKIDKKMREEIIPEMLKNANMRNLRFDSEDTDEGNDDLNPDWAEDFENSPLGEKLREMNELQMEGADVYMSTFAQLKQYPFFKTMGNWFYPFDRQHSSVVEELGDSKESSILNMILQSGLFCDSDKYSLCFTILHIPKSQREAMMSQLSEEQMNELMDKQKISSSNTFANQPEAITNQYLHNLYRFFKLYPRRHEFRDIFKDPIRLHEYPVLKPILHKADLLQNLADYYFRKEYYANAAKTYTTLLGMSEPSAEIYQKIGFCYQKEKKMDQAIGAYLKSDMIKPDSIWTNRHLAVCYRTLCQYEKAIEYYRKVESVQPENRNLIFNIGSCLTELERYDEALKSFFKLDFLEPDNIKAWRAIGWCSFVTGKLEQAMRYYERIIKKHPLAPDYLNTGHVAWSMGNLPLAMEMYTKSIEVTGNKSLFLDVFYKDKELLMQQGIDEDDISLMYDLL